MKIRLLMLFFIVSLTGSAWARLGETEEQLIARYGDVLGHEHVGADAGHVAVDKLQFKKTGFNIEVTIFHGVSAQEDISNAQGDGMTAQEVKTLLDANTDGHAWTAVAGGQYWKRDDGALATFNGGFLRLQAKDLMDAEAEAYKTAHARSLEGF